MEAHLKAARRKLGVSSTSDAIELLRDHTVEPYYDLSDLPYRPAAIHPHHLGHLHEASSGSFFGRPKRFWEADYELTTRQTVIAMIAAALILILAVAVLIAAAQGFYSVFHRN